MKGTRRSERERRQKGNEERGVSIFSGIAFSGSLYYPFYTGSGHARELPSSFTFLPENSSPDIYVLSVSDRYSMKKLQKEKQSAACYDMIYGDSSCAAGKRGCIGKKERREKECPMPLLFSPLLGGNSERQVRIRQGIRILRKAEQVFP